MRALAALAGLAVVVVVGVTAGWKWILAPLLALVIIGWARATFRAMAHDVQDLPGDPIPVAAEGARTLYWCEECGSELVLTVRGSATAPRHCGAKMHERTELPPNSQD